jgi:hypothetical protein
MQHYFSHCHETSARKHVEQRDVLLEKRYRHIDLRACWKMVY